MNLHNAAERDDAKSVQELLGAGQPVNGLDKQGNTPLMLAASMGADEAARALIDGGANGHAIDRNGCSVLSCAVAAGNTKLIQLLLARGAEPNGNRPYVVAGKTQ